MSLNPTFHSYSILALNSAYKYLLFQRVWEKERKGKGNEKEKKIKCKNSVEIALEFFWGEVQQENLTEVEKISGYSGVLGEGIFGEQSFGGFCW